MDPTMADAAGPRPRRAARSGPENSSSTSGSPRENGSPIRPRTATLALPMRVRLLGAPDVADGVEARERSHLGLPGPTAGRRAPRTRRDRPSRSPDRAARRGVRLEPSMWLRRAAVGRSSSTSETSAWSHTRTTARRDRWRPAGRAPASAFSQTASSHGRRRRFPAGCGPLRASVAQMQRPGPEGAEIERDLQPGGADDVRPRPPPGAFAMAMSSATSTGAGENEMLNAPAIFT